MSVPQHASFSYQNAQPVSIDDFLDDPFLSNRCAEYERTHDGEWTPFPADYAKHELPPIKGTRLHRAEVREALRFAAIGLGISISAISTIVVGAFWLGFF